MEAQDYSSAFNGLAIAPFIVGIVMIVAGIVMLIFPPKKINRWYGYRTTNSMSSEEQWNFAQRYSAKTAIIIGTLLTFISALGDYMKPQGILSEILAGAVIISAIILLILITERAIKKKFAGA